MSTHPNSTASSPPDFSRAQPQVPRTAHKLIPELGRPERIADLIGPVTPASAQQAADLLLSYSNQGEDPVTMRLSGPGGCVFSGLALLDVIEHVPIAVFTVGFGVVASMAGVLLACGEPGHRYALPRARIMLHGGSGQSAGKIEEILSASRLYHELEREIQIILAERTGLTRARVRALQRRQRYLTAVEARAAGIIDHIL